MKVRKMKAAKPKTEPVTTSVPLPVSEPPGPPRRPDRFSILNEELDSLPIRNAYPKLVEKLQLDIKRIGDAKLRELILEVSEDRRVAGYIMAVARDNLRRLEDEYELQFGKWIVQARAEIAELKKAKEWEGGVNKEDVQGWIAANVPGWKELKSQIRDAERVYKSAEAFYEAYRDRGTYLQTFARLVEKRQGIEIKNPG